MAHVFKDMETIVVNADLLSSCEPFQHIDTPKRRTSCKNLFWWLRYYPNGRNVRSRGYMSVFIHTSVGRFDAGWVMTVDRSDIREEYHGFYKNALKDGCSKLASHAEIHTGSIIQNGVFVIRCKINFYVNLDTLPNTIASSTEDTCIIKFDRRLLETYEPGQQVEIKRMLGDVMWCITYYPCGSAKEYKRYISVFFHIIGDPVNVEYSCAMPICGALVQLSGHRDSKESQFFGYDDWFSRRQCQIADHDNGIVDLVCKVKFNKPAVAVPAPLSVCQTNLVEKRRKSAVRDSATLTIFECQLEGNEIGDFDSTVKKFAEGSKHQWRLLCYPNGATPHSTGHVSLIVEASTTETETVILSGVIKIDGTPFEKKFNMFVEKDSNLAFPKLISHEELRRIVGIIDSQITITCHACFETQLFII